MYLYLHIICKAKYVKSMNFSTASKVNFSPIKKGRKKGFFEIIKEVGILSLC